MKAKTKLRRFSRINRKLKPIFEAVDNVVSVVDAGEYARANKTTLITDFDIAVKSWREGIDEELIKNILIHGQVRKMHREKGFVTYWDMDKRKREVVRFIYEVLYTNRIRRLV